MEGIQLQVRNALLEAALQIARRLRRRVTAEGFPVTLLQGETGEVIDSRPIVYDLGDYAPFVAFLGQESGEDELVDWAVGQGRIALGRFQNEEGFFAFPREGKGPFRPLWVDR